MGLKNKTLAPGGLYMPHKTNYAIIEVEFGSPMKSCLHYGICRINLPSADIREQCPCLAPAAIHNFGSELIQLIFDKNKIPQITFEKHFKNGFFQVDDSYEITQDILQKIGLKKFIIKKGIYPVLAERNILKIIF